MERLRRRRNVYRNARQLVQCAIQKDYSYEQIAEICEVSVGTVSRWLSTNRADASKIKALEEELGQTYLPAEAVGDILIELYRMRKKRYRIKRVQLKQIAGRSTLRVKFCEILYEYLLDRGYFMLESVEEEDFFIIIRKGQLLRHVKDYLDKSEIKQYFKAIADSIDAGDEDNE